MYMTHLFAYVTHKIQWKERYIFIANLLKLW